MLYIIWHFTRPYCFHIFELRKSYQTICKINFGPNANEGMIKVRKSILNDKRKKRNSKF